MNRTETARLRRALRRRPTVADRVRVALAGGWRGAQLSLR